MLQNEKTTERERERKREKRERERERERGREERTRVRDGETEEEQKDARVCLPSIITLPLCTSVTLLAPTHYTDYTV